MPAIEECYIRSWRAAYDGQLPPAVLDDGAEERRGFDWTVGIRSDTSVVLVAPGAEDGVAGVVLVDEAPPPPRRGPEVVMLYVDPDAWGTGVAAQLLAAGVRWAEGRGHVEVRLRAVEGQRRARRFYERESWEAATDLAPDRKGPLRLVWYRRRLVP